MAGWLMSAVCSSRDSAFGLSMLRERRQAVLKIAITAVFLKSLMVYVLFVCFYKLKKNLLLKKKQNDRRKEGQITICDAAN